MAASASPSGPGWIAKHTMHCCILRSYSLALSGNYLHVGRRSSHYFMSYPIDRIVSKCRTRARGLFSSLSLGLSKLLSSSFFLLFVRQAVAITTSIAFLTTISTSYEPLLCAFLHHPLYLAFHSPHQPPLQDLALIVYEEKLVGFQRQVRFIREAA